MTTTNMFLNFGGKWDSPWPLFSSREGVVSRQAIDSQLRTGTDKGNLTV